MGMGMGPAWPRQCRFHAASSLCHATGARSALCGANNPLTPDGRTSPPVRTLYRQYCASCHGIDGLGDGDAGKTLQPPPANLAWSTETAHCHGRLSTGRSPRAVSPSANSHARLQDVLSEHQIWQIISLSPPVMRLPFAIGPAQSAAERRKAL